MFFLGLKKLDQVQHDMSPKGKIHGILTTKTRKPHGASFYFLFWGRSVLNGESPNKVRS